MKKTLSIIIIVGIFVGVAGFYGGMKYEQNKASQEQASRQNTFKQLQNLSPEERQKRMQEMGIENFGGRQNGQNGTRGGFGSVPRGTSGEIIAKDDQSITVKLTDGGSKIVFVSAQTAVTTIASGSIDNLVVGTQVVANGTQNSDGSVTAQTIQVR